MPIPERWEMYSPFGKVIPGTNLIAFKVPLKEILFTKLPQKDWFTPSMLIQQIRDQGINLRLVIDLTFTRKYYSPAEFTSQDIQHKKIFTQGQVVPSNDVYAQFASTVKELDKDHVIGVHCTHGINRTGYLICRYMIEELKFDPNEAIRLFNDSRGHKLERQNYLQDLKCRIPGEVTQVTGDIPEAGDNPRIRKPRWRHHREDHIGWRSEKSQPTGGKFQTRQDSGGYSNGKTYAGGYQGPQNSTRNYGGNYGQGYHRTNGESRNHEHLGRESHAQNCDTKYPNRSFDRRYQGDGYRRNYDSGYQNRGYDPYGRNYAVGFQGRGFYSGNQVSRYQGRGYYSGNHDSRYQGRGGFSRNHDPRSKGTKFHAGNHGTSFESGSEVGRDVAGPVQKR